MNLSEISEDNELFSVAYVKENTYFNKFYSKIIKIKYFYFYIKYKQIE